MSVQAGEYDPPTRQQFGRRRPGEIEQCFDVFHG
jgi:hypothetical protein